MKKILMAVALIAYACVAGAVTVQWKGQIKGNDKYGGWLGVAILSGSVTTAPAYGSLLNVSGNTATWKGPSDNFIGFAQPSNDGYQPTLSSGTAGTYGIWGEENGTPTPQTFYGEFKLDSPDGKFAMIVFNQWNSAYTVYNFQLQQGMLDATEPVSVDLGTLGWESGPVKLHNDGAVAVLPEPTVLALLALGVAGLALKRRTH